MGAFFTNVQVRGASTDALVAAIRGAAVELVEVAADGVAADDVAADEGHASRGDDEGTPVDRTVLVLPPDDAGWIAIYDEATESDAAALEALAKLASSVGSHAVAVSVHDSDILLLSLFERGERIDRYDSAPDYYRPDITDAKRAALAGSPSKWRGVLPSGGGEGVLREAFDTKETFAERTLSRIAKLVGWERAQTGYRYAVSDGVPLPEGTVTLRFRERAAASTAAFTGPPAFSLHSYGGTGKRMSYPLDVPVALSVAFRNQGGDGRGLAVSAWGSALDTGLVRIEAFELVLGAERRRVMLEATRTTATSGEHVTAGEAPDVRFEAGIPTPRPGKDIVAFMKALERGVVHVHVHASPLREGQGELFCGLVPRENTKGSDGHRFELAITPASPTTTPERVGRTKKPAKRRQRS